MLQTTTAPCLQHLAQHTSSSSAANQPTASPLTPLGYAYTRAIRASVAPDNTCTTPIPSPSDNLIHRPQPTMKGLAAIGGSDNIPNNKITPQSHPASVRVIVDIYTHHDPKSSA
jgi:hypothetical protein